MSDLKQTRGAFEAFVGHEGVQAEAVANDWDIELYYDFHELVDLLGGQKLGFVDEDTVDVGIFFFDAIKDISAAIDGKISIALWPDAREQLSAVLGVCCGLYDANLLAAFFVIKCHLE